jgi:hypothetical protein
VPPFFFCTRLDRELELSLALVEPPAQQMQTPLVDWDTLRIMESQDEDGRIKIVDDEVMYELLGFRAEDEEAGKARKATSKGCDQQNDDTW